MPITRIMLLGANGQMGQALRQPALPTDWQLGAFGHAECDITDHRAMQVALHHFKPALVINAAAMTAVDACEKNPDSAVAVNFEAAANLAAQCAFIDVPLIHLSTDYVFDGTDNERPRRPDDKMNPVNVYGNTKLMGEESIRHEHPWHVILRISSVFSQYGNNLLIKALKSIDENDELNIVTDQTACPTYAPDAAKAIISIADALLHGKVDGFGTYHYCGDPAATRMEFMQEVMKRYAPFTTKRPALHAARSSDFPALAQRPAYSALDCSKIKDIYGIAPQAWRERLAECIQVMMSHKGKAA
jgi:dTDP-4-dehydrorhamnose reductase